MVDISTGGARVRGLVAWRAGDCRPGTVGELKIAAYGVRVACKVAPGCAPGSDLHLVFDVPIELPRGLAEGIGASQRKTA
jgi:hypothetical protein